MTKVPRVWFDYTNQCWIEDGLIAKCGHSDQMPGCYACSHHGEPADPSHYTEE